jgi:hypothetical protein
LAPGVLIVRGNHRQKTFLTDGDYQAYLKSVIYFRAATKSSSAILHTEAGVQFDLSGMTSSASTYSAKSAGSTDGASWTNDTFLC